MSFLRDQWPYLAGALGLGGIIVLAIRTRPGAPDAPRSSTAPGGASPSRSFLKLDDDLDPVRVFAGRRYRACVRPGAFNPVRLVSDQTIVDKMTEAGFKDIVVAPALPAAWPALLECWRYIEATWAGEDGKLLSRPGAVELAWLETTA